MNFELWPQKRKIKRHRAPHHRPQNNQLDSSKGKPGGRSSRSPPRYSRTCFTQSIRGNSIFTLPFAMIALSKQQPPEEKDRSAHVHAEKRPGEVYRYKGQQPGERGGPQWANAGAGGGQANKNTVNRQKRPWQRPQTMKFTPAPCQMPLINIVTMMFPYTRPTLTREPPNGM